MEIESTFESPSSDLCTLVVNNTQSRQHCAHTAKAFDGQHVGVRSLFATFHSQYMLTRPSLLHTRCSGLFTKITALHISLCSVWLAHDLFSSSFACILKLAFYLCSLERTCMVCGMPLQRALHHQHNRSRIDWNCQCASDVDHTFARSSQRAIIVVPK